MCGKNYLCENNNDMPVLVVFLTCINTNIIAKIKIALTIFPS